MNIERILTEVLNTMALEGFKCSGKIATATEFYKISNVEDSIFPAFLFQISAADMDVNTLETSQPFIFMLCFNAENTDNIIEVEKFEELRRYYKRFFNKLRMYENTDGQQIVNVTRATIEPYYFDISFLDVQTKGFRCEMTVNIQMTDKC